MSESSLPFLSIRSTRRDWLRSAGFLSAGVAMGIGPSWPAATADEPSGDSGQPIQIGSRRELFVDAYLVERLQGELDRRMHSPQPQDVVIEHTAPWEGSGSGYHTVFRDGDLYRMYYRGLHLDVQDGRLNAGRHEPFYCYAESTNGWDWVKPELGLIEFNGSKKNNIILRGRGAHNFSPMKDGNPSATKETRYKALGGLQREGGLSAFGSSDGVHWSLIRDEPVITEGAFDSQNLAFWDPAIGKYRAYYRIFTAGVTDSENWKPGGYRAIRTATSDDFLDWTDAADLQYGDAPPTHLYTNQVAPYDRAPHILIGLPARYVDRGWSPAMRALVDRENRELRAAANQRYGTAVTETLLMSSRDGVHFDRWEEAFLRPGIERKGTWQYGQHYAAWHLVETASRLPGAPRELSIYSTEDYWHGKGGKLRRYTLRLDGFVSVHASRKGGELTTKPLVFEGDELNLNFSTSAVGSIRVELQDVEGNPIEGFTLDDCSEMFGDTVERRVRWKEHSDLAALAGRPVRIRFLLSDADLYAFQFEPR